VSTTRFASMLQKAIGLDEASIGPMAIRHAIRRRMQKTGVADEESFLALLQTSQTEMTNLIEEIVVPETWFFRQEEAFRLMQSHLCGRWQRNHPDQIPRLLSIPSSSGEEAFSLAMTLLDAGFTAQGFHIDAIDISRKNLNKARRALYGNSSFRGNHLDFRQRHFRQTKAGYVLHPSIRHAVHFYQGNILDHARMQKFGDYDIIFCRNLLIYFNKDNRNRTVKLMAGMLRKDGLLFVGHAETGLMWKELFASVAHPMAFAYRHPDSGDRMNYTAHPKKRTPKPPDKNKKTVTLPVKRVERQKSVSPLVATPIAPVKTGDGSNTGNTKAPSLEEASRLADAGRLQEARQQCESYLQQQGASAQAWYLLGLINDIQGYKKQARSSFRKALYLEPDHYEALLHLALLLDQLGESHAAQRLHERIQRVNTHRQTGAIRP